MKTTKIIIKTLSELLPTLKQDNDISKWIYNRLDFYTDLMKRNSGCRDYIKHAFYDLWDYSNDALTYFQNYVDVINNPNWIKIVEALKTLEK